MSKIITLFFIMISISVSAQETDDYKTRLRAIHNTPATYYNIDGVDFTSQTLTNSFTEKDLKSIYKKFGISNEESKLKDDSLLFNNFHIIKRKKVTDSLTLITTYYFVEDKQKKVTAFCFNYFENRNPAFERKFIDLIINDQIPNSVFENERIDSIDFAGRKIQLSRSCNWTNVNTVQCTYNGEMNWSIHLTLLSAKNAIKNQLSLTKSKNGLKVISEEEVDIIFENTPTKVLKVIFGFTGVTNLLVKTSGAKTLTAYYVANKIRGNYISCVLSFWNNDNINPSGLPPLLNKVMQLTK